MHDQHSLLDKDREMGLIILQRNFFTLKFLAWKSSFTTFRNIPRVRKQNLAALVLLSFLCVISNLQPNRHAQALHNIQCITTFLESSFFCKNVPVARECNVLL